MLGYAFAFSTGHPFIGFWDKFGLSSVVPTELGHWFLTAAVAALPSALAAGPVAERCHLTGHLVLALFLAGLQFPLPAHWIMAEGGWLQERGVGDAGGALAVHAMGGVAGLVGCLLVGRRAERLVNHRALLPGHSLPLVVLGGVLVSMGIVAKLVGLGGAEPGALVTNSMLAGSSGALLAHKVFVIPVQRGQRYDVSTDGPGERRLQRGRRWSLLIVLCGGQAGQVSVSGVGPALPPWGPVLAGLVGGAAFCLCKGLLGLCHLDDPVHGVATQLFGAVVGTLVAGLTGLAITGDGTQVAWHLLALLAVAAWTAVSSVLIMFPLLACGKLRIVDADECTGVDIKKIHEPAYFNGAEGDEQLLRQPAAPEPCGGPVCAEAAARPGAGHQPDTPHPRGPRRQEEQGQGHREHRLGGGQARRQHRQQQGELQLPAGPVARDGG